MSLLTGKVYDTAVQTVQVNQVVIFNHQFESRWVVYKIENDPRWGYTYHVVSLEDPHFGNTQRLTPWREKFGIGWYYDDQTPEMMDGFEVALLCSQAQVKAEREAEAKRERDERTERLKTVGRERLQHLVPTDAQAVIVAEEREDDSNPYTDYFSSHTVRTVILGFSRHTRDLFGEMRKYAPNFEETAYLAEENEDYEQREKYSGGAGYYLGGSGRYGWIIRKERIGDRERFIERFAIVAGDENNIHIKADAIPTAGPTGTVKEAITGNFEIVNYSDKAVAVFGDTRAVKDTLKALGGRFNPKLSHEGGKRAGWIFQKTKEQELRGLLAIN
jgi:hypothetical protein